MAKRKTWLWIIVGIVGFCVLVMIAIAGAGIYFVSKHISTQHVTSAEALRALDERRSTFLVKEPLIELDEFDHARSVRNIAGMPTSSVKPHDLYILAWNPETDRLVRISVPFWVLHFGKRKMEIAASGRSVDLDRLHLTVPDLERIGPALILDFRPASGERVLVWTQ
jgi:hypothetical protein